MFEYGKIIKDKINRKYIYDLVLLAAFLFGGIISFFIVHHNNPGEYIEITCNTVTGVISYDIDITDYGYYLLTYDMDGNDIGSVQLSDRLDNITDIILTSIDEYNVLQVDYNGINVIEASCPDLICVHTRNAHNTGDTICCLPHKLVINIVGDNIQEDDVDAVTW